VTDHGTLEDVDDELEGAVIDSVEAGETGLHINLKDGRILVFPDAVIVAVLASRRTLQ
jgi:hypothetical protein